MKIANAATVSLGAIALFAAADASSVQATDMDDYRWTHGRADCRVVETHRTNRWGDDVTVRRHVCG